MSATSRSNNALPIALGIGIASLAVLYARRVLSKSASNPTRRPMQNVSTTSSGHDSSVYETQKAVSEYLLFHFGTAEDILPYPNSIAPHNALNFTKRTAKLCIEWAKKQNLPLDGAFDVGCAVGGSSFALSQEFQRVVGLDFSHAFINAAIEMKQKKRCEYQFTIEGENNGRGTADLPSGSNPEHVSFMQGDACNLPSLTALGGKFSVIHGANLLCRLPDPMAFLTRLPELLVPGGLVVFISPYSWLEQYTTRERWLGGKDGKASFAGLEQAMNSLGFILVHQEDVPFLIREHARKFQWGCSHATVWKLTN